MNQKMIKTVANGLKATFIVSGIKELIDECNNIDYSIKYPDDNPSLVHFKNDDSKSKESYTRKGISLVYTGFKTTTKVAAVSVIENYLLGTNKEIQKPKPMIKPVKKPLPKNKKPAKK